jgi:hypothetical protein
MLLLKIFYIALFVAIFFFGSLQEYLDKKISAWDLRKGAPELRADENSTPADPEKMGSMLPIMLILLASAFFIWKILTATFPPF